MATITAQDVKELRARTGAGMLDARNALKEADGNIDEAITLLQKKGAKIAAKKATRNANEGLVVSYIHGAGRVGVLLELNCETDFVAKNEDFQALAHDIAMHIAAMDPEVISPEDVTKESIEKQQEIVNAQLKEEGKPEAIWDKISEGKIKKFCEEKALLTQSFVKDPKQTVNDHIVEAIGKIGENIKVGRFSRFDIKGSATTCSVSVDQK